MASDPRFNFYPDNYEGGTEFFTLEEDGAYLRLLMLQFRRGHFTEKEAIMKLMQRCPANPEKAKSVWLSIKDKFETENGFFWNKRLRFEIKKSSEYSDSQAQRAKEGWEKRKAEADNLAKATHEPETSPDDASISISNSINKSSSKTNSKKNTADGLDLFFSDRVEIVKELNELTGRSFEPHAEYFKKDVDARLKEGFSVDDHRMVIQVKVLAWGKNPDMKQNLRPQTLFCKKHFAEYLREAKDHINNGTRPSQPTNIRSTHEDRIRELAEMRAKQKQGL